jgi:adenylyltransferase/sulfurtransferase
LVLGVGGLGCGVSMGLARLGVKKIIMLDKDVVDASNLNRQILFRPEDVGLPKATQGKIRLEEQHKINPDMEVVAL